MPLNTQIQEQESGTPASQLGAFIKKARQDLGMTLREVEEATEKQISNGYLSQLEQGKIAKPSPKVLHTLSVVLKTSYEELMERSGYILPKAKTRGGTASTKPLGRSIGNLSAGEEEELLKYLSYLRSQKKST